MLGQSDSCAPGCSRGAPGNNLARPSRAWECPLQTGVDRGRCKCITNLLTTHSCLGGKICSVPIHAISPPSSCLQLPPRLCCCRHGRGWRKVAHGSPSAPEAPADKGYTQRVKTLCLFHKHASLDGDMPWGLTMTAREHTEGEFGNREREADECPPAKKRSSVPPRELLGQTCNIRSPQSLRPRPDDFETFSHCRTFWPNHSRKLSSRGTLWKYLVTQHVFCVTVYLDLIRCAFHVQKQFIDTNAQADPEGCLLQYQAHSDMTLSPR